MKLVFAGIILLIIIFGAFFQIKPEELGVITRYGKFSRTVEPGLNFKIPLVETIYKVPVERKHKDCSIDVYKNRYKRRIPNAHR